MINRISKLFSTALGLGGVLTTLALPLSVTHAADSLFKDPIVAKGKDVEVTRSMLDEAFVAFKASALASRRPISEAQRPGVEANLLDRLIVSQLLLKKATAEDKQLGKEKAAEFMREIEGKISSESIFKSQLKAMGISKEKFEARALEDATCEQVLEREVKEKVTITDEQIQKHYDENPKQFEQPELAKGFHILLATRDSRTGEDFSAAEKKARREAIEKLRIRAKAGEDFPALAKEYSEHPAAKENGGQFTVPRNSREPELEAAAFALEPDQVSEVVTSPYGYHIIRLKEKTPAKKLPLDEVSKDVKKALTMQEVRKQLPSYFEKLKKDAEIVVTLGK